MTTFRATLAYDGTGFAGWQRQAGGVSIQGLIEDALAHLEGRPVAVHGAGRTDAGVHALGQVASFSLDRPIDAATLRRALNAHLPGAIRALEVAAAPGFHARFDARAKTYRYRIANAEVLIPFERLYALHVPRPLDAEAMDRAGRLLEGRHDFAAFQASGGGASGTTREITCCRLACAEDRIVAVEITGTGFLRHMVRTIAGSLIEVGRGRRPASWLGDLLVAGDRALAGPTAPAHGLFLVGVEYDS
ncbi:MAG: tRNA pseudouridine(38-40) synthase TruA [Acidobacteria bacterium]|nr:tRNA pseudouridine(38-40) synthase TruA [Acidobacteriota bacterium]